jgi:type IV fimbrial biogenesis protein FimT
VNRQGVWEDERGFSLVELMVVIVIMGVVAAIAISTWTRVIDGRRVDSATNQVAADLRLAHSKATNRLASHQFVAPAAPVPAGVFPLSTYNTGPTGTLALNRLPDGTRLTAATSVEFKADGSAVVTGANPITVRSSTDATYNHTIQINPVTSRIRVVP